MERGHTFLLVYQKDSGTFRPILTEFQFFLCIQKKLFLNGILLTKILGPRSRALTVCARFFFGRRGCSLFVKVLWSAKRARVFFLKRASWPYKIHIVQTTWKSPKSQWIRMSRKWNFLLFYIQRIYSRKQFGWGSALPFKARLEQTTNQQNSALMQRKLLRIFDRGQRPKTSM